MVTWPPVGPPEGMGRLATVTADTTVDMDSVAAMDTVDFMAAMDTAAGVGAAGVSALVIGRGITDMDTIRTHTGILIRPTVTHTTTHHTDPDMPLRPNTPPLPLIPRHTDTDPDTIRMRTPTRDRRLE